MKQINIFFLIFILFITNSLAANNSDFEDWKKHRKPKGAYLGTFISGGPGGSNPTYRKYYKGMLD